MPKFARLWIFCTPAEPSELPGLALLRTSRMAGSLQRVVAAPGDAHERLAAVCARDLRCAESPEVSGDLSAPAPSESSEAVASRVAAALDALARRCAGGHAAVFVDPSTAARALSHGLRIDAADSERTVSPEPGSLAALDWPAEPNAGLRPSVVGVGLDWFPPGPPEHTARFPGGPGSAPSSRA